MPDDPKPSDQFEDGGDAVKDGGATTDRGHRDTGQPGPAPDAADRESERGRPARPEDRKSD